MENAGCRNAGIDVTLTKVAHCKLKARQMQLRFIYIRNKTETLQIQNDQRTLCRKTAPH
jgi:hypothetical protein